MDSAKNIPNWNAFQVNDFKLSHGIDVDVSKARYPVTSYDGIETATIKARHPWGDVTITAIVVGLFADREESLAIAGWQCMIRHFLSTPGLVSEEWQYNSDTRDWSLISGEQIFDSETTVETRTR